MKLWLPEPRSWGGDVAFKLHDTYGFPVDLTADVCREKNVSVDFEGFDALMEKQREQARAKGKIQDGSGPRIRRQTD